MPNYFTHVEFARRNGIPRDNIVNTFAVSGDGTGTLAADINAIESALVSVYILPLQALNGEALSSRMSAVIFKGLGLFHTMKTWQLSDLSVATPEGSPDRTTMFGGLVDSPISPLPAQVNVKAQLIGIGAADLPIEAPDDFGPAPDDADVAPERPRSRAFGEFNFGPLTEQATDTSNFEAVVAADLREAIVEAFSTLQSDLNAVDLQVGVWSRVDQLIRPVQSVKVDNRFDTMRSRLTRPTAATIGNVEP